MRQLGADTVTGQKQHTESTEGGAFLYLFSRFLFGAGLCAGVDLGAKVLPALASSCFTPGWGDAVAGDEIGLGYIPEEMVSTSGMGGRSNYAGTC